MSKTNQVMASMARSMRIFLRDKAIFGSSVFIPAIFLLLLPQVMFSDAPGEIMPALKGYLVIAMIILLIASIGVSNLAGSIASDRDHDLYSKLSSMPISPWYESLGRVMAVMIFSAIGSMLLMALGLIYGAELALSWLDIVLALGIGFIVAVAAVGIGMILACVVRSESAAAHVGVAIVLVNYFIGVAIPYGSLPDLLKPLARINPISSGNGMIATLALGMEYIGYNPWNFLDLGLLVGLSLVLFTVGLTMYAKLAWRR